MEVKISRPLINLKNLDCNILAPTKGLSKPDWLRYRQKGIGGSDIASVCGINSWKSPLALWHEKTEKIKDDEEENIPAEVGIALEPFMKRRFEKWLIKEGGQKNPSVFKVPYILQNKDNPIALANIDGAFIRQRPEGWHSPDPEDLYAGLCITEYKTTSEFFYKQWQDDNLPDNYYLQVQWYLYVTGLEYCYLSFLIGNRKFDVLIIKRNQEVIDEIVGKAEYFWKTYVTTKTPPAPLGDISSGETLNKMYPREEEGKIIDCTGDKGIQHNITKIEFVNTEIKNMKQELEVNKQAIKAKMEDSEMLICGDKKVVWREQIRKEYIVKESKFRMFRISNYKEAKI